MKQFTFLAAILILWSGFAWSQSGKLYVKVNTENIRKNPNGEIIAEAMAGTKVEVLEKQKNWVKVQFTGWIWENSLTSDPTRVEGYKIEASHILVSTLDEAKKIQNLLKNGEDFAQLAQKYSIDRASGLKGGSLGMFGRGDFVPEFDDAAFRLKVGEISAPVKTSLGYSIIKRTK